MSMPSVWSAETNIAKLSGLTLKDIERRDAGTFLF